MGFIYRITSPSYKSYIGQTTRPIEERFREYRRKSDCMAISNAIQFYGWEKMTKEYIEIPDEDLNFYEEMLIGLLGTLTPNGYNIRKGGLNFKMREETKKKIGKAHTGRTLSKEHRQKLSESNIGNKHTDEAKKKMSESRKGEKNHNFGKPKSEETKAKLSEAHKGEKSHNWGKPKSEETKAKLSEALKGEKHYNYGKSLSEETKAKMSEAHTGKTASKETRDKISESKMGENNIKSKKVYKYDMDGNLIDFFASSGEAARSLGLNDGSVIRRCVRGKLNTAYGFIWTSIQSKCP